MPLYIAKSGDLEGCHACLTDRLTTLKDRATQLLIRYKSGALVTQSKELSAILNTCQEEESCARRKRIASAGRRSEAEAQLHAQFKQLS